MKHKKILVALLTLILAVGTGMALLSSQNTSTVQASKKSSYYYKRLAHNAYVYHVDKNWNIKRYGHKVYRRGQKIRIYNTRVIWSARLYRIGRNRYIKCGNFAKRPITRTETTAIATRHTRAIFTKGPTNDKDVYKGFKKGHIFHFDEYGLIDEGVCEDLAFRIKGTPGEWIMAKDVIPKQELKYSGDGIR